MTPVDKSIIHYAMNRVHGFYLTLVLILQEKMKVCLHGTTFVYHYKGSTIGKSENAARENFRTEGR